MLFSVTRVDLRVRGWFKEILARLHRSELNGCVGSNSIGFTLHVLNFPRSATREIILLSSCFFTKPIQGILMEGDPEAIPSHDTLAFGFIIGLSSLVIYPGVYSQTLNT